MTKKTSVIIVVIIIVIIAIVLVVARTPKHIETPLAQVESATESTSSPVVITTLNPNVLVKEMVASDFTPVASSATTTSGATVKTGPVGRALIESSTAHRTLVDFNSEIIVADSSHSSQENKTSIKLLAGALWTRLEKVFDKGEFYEIKTTNAVAAVRGTSFGVWYTIDTTWLRVTDGAVALSSIDPKTGMVIPGTEVLVKAGQKAECEGTKPIVVTSIDAQDKKLAWYVYNNPKATSTPAQVIPPKTTPTPKPIQPAPTPTPTPVQKLPPRVGIILPSTVQVNSTSTITIGGENLSDVKQVYVGPTLASFVVKNSTTIEFFLPKVDPDTYTITVVDGDGTRASKSAALSVTPIPQQKTTTQSATYNLNQVQ